MSKILYLHQYFKTPSEAGASRSYFLAKAMVKAGHQVTLITQGDETKTLNVDGIEVVMLKNQYSNKMGILDRIKSYFGFYWSAKNAAKKVEFDLVYATSTPLLVGWLGRKLALKKKVAYFFEVRDLWPDFPIQAGVLPFPFATILRKMERLIYRDAQKVVTCSKGIYEKVIQRTIPGKVIMAPNFSPFEKKEMNPNSGNFIYFGSLGRFNGIDLWRPFLEKWKNQNSNAQWYVMGEGAQEALVEQYSQEFPFVHFLPPIPRNELLAFIQEKQIRYSWVTFSNLPVLQTNSPNKLFDSWQWGLIPIINQEGWMKDWCDKGAGVFYDSKFPEKTIQQILEINHSEDLFQIYQKGILGASTHFDAEKAIHEVITNLPSLPYKPLKWAIVSTVHASYDQRLSQRIPELISAHHQVYYLGKGRGLPTVSSPFLRVIFFYPWIFSWILFHRINGIHLADPELLPLGIFLRKLGYRIVWDVHEDFDEQFDLKNKKQDWIKKWIYKLEKILLNQNAKLIVTESYYANLRRYQGNKAHFLPNYPSSYPFKLISNQFSFESEFPKFIYVGVINEHRGMFDLFHAWERIKEKYPKSELILVGKSSINIPKGMVHLEGNWLEIAPKLAGAWAGISLIEMVNPATKYPFFSFPTKIGEYAALGLPVICNETPAHRSYLKDSAIYLSQVNPLLIQQVILHFIENPEFRRSKRTIPFNQNIVFENNNQNLSKSSELYNL